MKSPPRTVRIIILNWNGGEILPHCLASLVRAAHQSRHKTKVTLLDNRSTDKSLEWSEAHFPEVEIAVAPENQFLVSFNDYVKQIEDEIVILMNNDIRVDPDFVDPLVDIFVEHPDAFLASPKVLSFEGERLEGADTRAAIRWGMFVSWGRCPQDPGLGKLSGHTFASGFGAFHRKRFLSLGGYDDLFLPGIMEDADLGFRAWREGYRSYYVPQSCVYHKGQASFLKAFGKKRMLALAHRNTFLFMWKNFSDPSIWLEHIIFLFPRLIYALLRGKIEWVMGFGEAFFKWGEAWRRRKKIERRAHSDRQILSLASHQPIPRRYRFKKKWKRWLLTLFDGTGSWFMRPRGAFDEKAVKKLLIIRIDSLGDGVLTLPAVALLEKKFPETQIDFVVSRPIFDLYRGIFPDSQYHVIEGDWLHSGLLSAAFLQEFFQTVRKLRKLNYDLAVDFRGDLRLIFLMVLAGIPHRWGRGATGGRFLLGRALAVDEEKHEILQNCDLVGEDGRIEFPQIYSASNNSIQSILAETEGRKKIVFHMGAGCPSKSWRVERYIALARRLQERHLGVPVFVGVDEEKKLLDRHRSQLLPDYVDLVGQTSIGDLLALFKGAYLFVGNDSGPAHLAALSGCRMIVIFSGTNPFRRWAPWSEHCRIIQQPVPCSPCEEKICPLGRQICLEDISLEEVSKVAEEMLSN